MEIQEEYTRNLRYLRRLGLWGMLFSALSASFVTCHTTKKDYEIELRQQRLRIYTDNIVQIKREEKKFVNKSPNKEEAERYSTYVKTVEDILTKNYENE